MFSVIQQAHFGLVNFKYIEYHFQMIDSRLLPHISKCDDYLIIKDERWDFLSKR